MQVAITQILGVVEVPSLAEEAEKWFLSPCLAYVHLCTVEGFADLTWASWADPEVSLLPLEEFQPARGPCSSGDRLQQSQTRALGSEFKANLPGLCMGHRRGERRPRAAWLAARGMGKTITSWVHGAGGVTSVISLALGWLSSSETQQRPRSQRPCFRQVGLSGTILSLPSFRESSPHQTAARDSGRGRVPSPGPYLPFTLVLWARGEFIKWDF